jgi:putative DNA primase/helicase
MNRPWEKSPREIGTGRAQKLTEGIEVRVKADRDTAKRLLEQNVNKVEAALETASEHSRQLSDPMVDNPSPTQTLHSGKKDGGAMPPLTASAPFDTAKIFAERECRINGVNILWFWQGQFWRWNGRFYAPEVDDVMRSRVYEFLDKAIKWGGSGQTERFRPNPRHVNEVLDGLKSGLALEAEYQPPMWLSTRKPSTDCIVFQNGIVNVMTGEKRELCPHLWVQSALPFDWNPDAECPTWDAFSANVFPEDEESQSFVEEFLGYCMTEETRFEKGAMFIGPKRSGKGTISYVLRQLVGEGAYVGLSFNTWAVGENSKECLIGKRVGVFADIRFKTGRAYGSSYDPGGMGHASKELLLNITGQDTLTIGRKYKSPWHGQLRLKVLLISNEVPNMNELAPV